MYERFDGGDNDLRRAFPELRGSGTGSCLGTALFFAVIAALAAAGLVFGTGP